MQTTKDHYILALEFAESRGTFTLDELAEAIKLDTKQEEMFALQIDRHQIFSQNRSSYFNTYKGNRVDLSFSVEDKFRLLNYQSLKEARDSSKSATYFAILALFISVASLTASVYMSHKQIESDVNIPGSFSEKIDGAIKNQEKIISALSEIDKNKACSGRSDRKVKQQ